MALPRWTSARTYVCESNGLRPFDHPGPKGQLHLADRAGPVFFCDTVELLHTMLTEPRPQRILAAYVQDAGRSEWMAPRGQWIDARSAWYVGGSKRIGIGVLIGSILPDNGTDNQG